MIFLAQTEAALADKALDKMTDLVQGGVVSIAIIALFALIVLVYFGGKIVTRLLDFLNRVTTAIEHMNAALAKLTDQAEAQSTLMGEIGASLRENKDSVDEMKRQVKLNTKVTRDYLSALTSSMAVLNRGFTRAEIFFKQRIEAVEKLIEKLHAEMMSAIAAKPQLPPSPQETIETGEP